MFCLLYNFANIMNIIYIEKHIKEMMHLMLNKIIVIY